MNPGRFYMPRLGASFTPMMGTGYLPTRGSVGLFGRITNSLKSFNWGGLLNGANKTLNVVNQTIPLVRQAGPMVSNMKNMFRIARAFGNETNKRGNVFKNINNTSNINNTARIQNNSSDKVSNNAISAPAENSSIREQTSDSYPNFFV